MDYLLDTNFLIGLWREPATGPEARFLAAKPDATLGIPWIVKAEFLAGAVVARHTLPRVAAFLVDYPVVWADEDILMRYAELYARSRRLGTQVGRNDLWIGAAAVARGLPHPSTSALPEPDSDAGNGEHRDNGPKHADEDAVGQAKDLALVQRESQLVTVFPAY